MEKIKEKILTFLFMEGLSYLRGELMKIKEVSEQCGLSSKSIRYYEAMGLLDVERSENGYREYDASQIERLKEIRLFRDLFIPIEDIRQYYESEQSMDEFMAQAMNKLQQQIEERKTARDFCAYIQLHYKEKMVWYHIMKNGDRHMAFIPIWNNNTIKVPRMKSACY